MRTGLRAGSGQDVVRYQAGMEPPPADLRNRQVAVERRHGDAKVSQGWGPDSGADNFEVIWLLRRLQPAFKTIAGFRRDNRRAFRQVFRSFVKLCRELGLY